MATHNLKIYACHAKDILRGYKDFEIRKDDRGYEAGDKLNFYYIQSARSYLVTCVIKYIQRGNGLLPGYVALGIMMVKNKGEAPLVCLN